MLSWGNSEILMLSWGNFQILVLPLDNSQLLMLAWSNSQLLMLPLSNSQLLMLAWSNSQILMLPLSNSQLLMLAWSNSQMLMLPLSNSQILNLFFKDTIVWFFFKGPHSTTILYYTILYPQKLAEKRTLFFFNSFAEPTIFSMNQKSKIHQHQLWILSCQFLFLSNLTMSGNVKSLQICESIMSITQELKLGNK